MFLEKLRGFTKKATRRSTQAVRLDFERLEQRNLFAIYWANEFVTSGPDNPHLDTFLQNEGVARQIVKRAISDWEHVVTNFNYAEDSDGNPNNNLNNVFNIKIQAAALAAGTRGTTLAASLSFNSEGKPTAATVQIDDDAAGTGWFFDQTPSDDAEFTAIVNSGSGGTGPTFQASFVDASTGGSSGYNDLYRTVVHEIGHALGIFNDSRAAIGTMIAPLVNSSQQPIIDPTGFTGTQLTRFKSTRTGTLFGVEATFIGAHIYEGDIYDTNNDPTTVFRQGSGTPLTMLVHPNELMNEGRTVPAGFPTPTPPIETTRQFISDLDAEILADAYGYTIKLPSTFNTANVTLDSLTGTLLVQGGVTSAGASQSDAISIDLVGSDIQVHLYSGSTSPYATETVPAAQVTQIVVSRAGDNLAANSGSLYVNSGLLGLVKEVYMVVSSNQDAIETGALGNAFVDLDTVVPGNQVTVRAAVMDANGGIGNSIYVPRGRYRLTLAGSGGDSQGDLDISKSITLVGTGAGETIIDAGGDTGILDRVFEVNASGPFVELTLDSLTVTGGRAPNISGSYESHGGGIFVRDGGILDLRSSAVVDNKTTSNVGIGGGVFFTVNAGYYITNSVITANASSTYTGGVYLDGASSNATVTVTSSVIANNTAAQGAGSADIAVQQGRQFSTGGNNLLGNAAAGFAHQVSGDWIKQPGETVDYVVTGIADTFNSADNTVVFSLREAINAVNGGTGAKEIWLPAWSYLLTRDRATFGGGSLTDTDAAFGDLDIGRSLTIRRAGPAPTVAGSSVKWRSDLPVDAVFDLLGDYDGNGITSADNGAVNAADYTTWRNTKGSTTDLRADGNDNGIVDQADYTIWHDHYGNTLSLLNV